MHKPALFTSVCSPRPVCYSPGSSDIIQTTVSIPHPPGNVTHTPVTLGHKALCNNANIAAKQHGHVSIVSPHHSHPPMPIKATFVSFLGVNTRRTISHAMFTSPSPNNDPVTTPSWIATHCQWPLQGQGCGWCN